MISSRWQAGANRALRRLTNPAIPQLGQVLLEQGEISVPKGIKLPAADPKKKPELYIAQLQRFTAAAFDYRKGNERWDAEPIEFSAASIASIARVGHLIGLIGDSYPRARKYSCAFGLGAGGMIAFERVDRINKLLHGADGHRIETSDVILTGSSRVLAGFSQDEVIQFAGEPAERIRRDRPLQEFDAMHLAAATAFDLNPDAYESYELGHTSSHFTKWSIRRFEQQTATGQNVTVLCAPSQDSGRRATTPHTYKFLAAIGAVPRNGRVLASTNARFSLFQTLDAVREMGIPHNVDVDVTGYAANKEISTMGPRAYAQWVCTLTGKDRDREMANVRDILQEIHSGSNSGLRLMKVVEPSLEVPADLMISY